MPRFGVPSAPGRMRVPSGNIRTTSPRSRIARAVVEHLLVARAAVDGERAERVEEPRLQAVGEQLLLRDVVDGAAEHRAEDERVEEAAVVGGEQQRALGGDVLAPDPLQAEVDVEERLEHRADDPVDDRVDALGAGALVQGGGVGHASGYTVRPSAVTVRLQAMAIDRAQTVRGALAGAVAAGVWAAQQPLDKRVFGVDYDDTELLGKLVTRGPAWRPVGRGDAPGQRRRVRRGLRRRRAVGPAPLLGPRPAGRDGRARLDLAADLAAAACTRRPRTSRRCSPTRARSRRRRGGTCSSGSCSASSSAG